MAQLRAKQIKLVAAGDLLIGGTGGNGSTLSIGTANQLLKVVDNEGTLSPTYVDNTADAVSFAPGESGITSTDVNSAIIEVAGLVSGSGFATLTEVNAIEAAVGLNSDGTLAAFQTGGVVAGLTTYLAAVNALDTAVGTKAAEADLTAEVTRATTAEEALGTRVDDLNTALGISGDAYTANGSANYISGATSFNNADVLLDTALKSLSDTVTGLAGLNALHFEGTVLITAVTPPATPTQGDMYKVIVDGTAPGTTTVSDWAGTGLGVNIGDYVVYTGTNWIKFDNTDEHITVTETGPDTGVLAVSGDANAGFVFNFDETKISFANLADTGTVADGFLKWDAGAITYVTLAISDITGLQTALDAKLDASALPVPGSDEFVGTDTFTLAHAPVAGSVISAINGLVVKPSLVTVTGSTVTFGSLGYTLDASDEVVFQYTYVA